MQQRNFLYYAVLLAIVGQASSRCECGYSINSTASEQYAVFTDILETDFIHFKNLTDSPCWQPQEYNVTAELARGPFGKAAKVANVIPNPLSDMNAWLGSGINGGDPGLQIWVRGQTADNMIPMGELASLRRDLSYGSYRVGMKLTAVPGTCAAFFWFKSNSEEIDMEFLSSSYNLTSHNVNLVMQTPQSVAAGFNAAGTSTYNVSPLPIVPTADFHEYRFDWTPAKVSFYVDGAWLYDMRHMYPTSGGTLFLNHWSNGDPHWSHGPPTTDAVITISYVKLYFNSTDPSRLQDFEGLCAGARTEQKEGSATDTGGSGSAVCQIPEQNGPPTGKISFINQTNCENPETTAGDESRGSSVRSLSSWAVTIAVVMGIGAAVLALV